MSGVGRRRERDGARRRALDRADLGRARRQRPWPVLLSGMGAAAVLFASVALTRNVIALGAINLLFGVGSGAILAASLAVIGDRAEDTHGVEMGRFDAINLFGWTAGLGIGIGFLGSLPNSRLNLVFALGAGLLAAAWPSRSSWSGGIPSTMDPLGTRSRRWSRTFSGRASSW